MKMNKMDELIRNALITQVFDIYGHVTKVACIQYIILNEQKIGLGATSQKDKEKAQRQNVQLEELKKTCKV